MITDVKELVTEETEEKERKVVINDPEEDVVSPTDQFLRGVSGRNRKLQEIMDQAGW